MLDIWKDFKGMQNVVAKQKESFSIGKITEGVEKMRPGIYSCLHIHMFLLGYADELKREEYKLLERKDKERSDLQEKGDKLFDAKEFKEALPIFKQLAEELPKDFWILAKAGICCTTCGGKEYINFSHPKELKEGEKLLLKLIELCPVLADPYFIYAHNLAAQVRMSISGTDF